jgi:hypothetical protein
MIHRRAFLYLAAGFPVSFAGTAGASSVGEGVREMPPVRPELAEYEKMLAGYPQLELLGIPRSWSLVREGFHPFAPERIVVLTPRGQARYSWLGSPVVKDELRRRVTKRPGWEQGLTLTEEKLDLIVGMIDRLTAYYRVPDYFESWVDKLTLREQLGSSGLGNGWGLAHQFQRPYITDWKKPLIPVVNPPVDWWLFLFPAGADFENLDHKAVHVVFAHVFYGAHPGTQLGVYCLVSQLGRELFDRGDDNKPALELANMDRVSVAHMLNQQIAWCLRHVRIP